MIKKLTSEVLEDILKRLEETTPIFDAEPGSIVRALVEILAEQFGQFYQELDFSTTMSFISTSKGSYLDTIGSLLDCRRHPGESDQNYRIRITQQVYVVAGASQTAVRLKVLSVDGVKDISMREFIRGTGSFCVYVITDDPVTSQETLNRVQRVLEEAKAFGIYAEARSPMLIPVELMVRVIFEDGTPAAQQMIQKENARRALQNYMDNIPRGGAFVVNEANRIMMNAGSAIQDLTIYRMTVHRVERFISNIQSTEGERIYLQRVDIS